jgi:signal peptidase I
MSEQDKPRSTRWRAWLLKKAKKLAVSVAVAVVLVVGVRTAVAEMFYVPTDAVAPEIPRNARVLVYKLSTTLQPHDIVVYRSGGVAMLGRVESMVRPSSFPAPAAKTSGSPDATSSAASS